MHKRLYIALSLLAAAAVIPAAAAMSRATTTAKAPVRAVTVFVTGLHNPRGLAFGPGGTLYVAEAGLGGSQMTTSADCQQVPFPVGPYSGGFTSRISRINRHGVRTTVVGRLPSSEAAPALNKLVSGVADIAFIRGTMYALEAGSGCSHGLVGTDNLVLRVSPNGRTTQVADLSKFLKSHPVKHPSADDFDPDGMWYSMVAVRGQLYAVESNHGEIDQINPKTGNIRRLVDVSATQGHIVPTALAYDGNFFFGNFGRFPIGLAREQVRELTPRAKIKTWARHLSTVLGLTFGPHHRLYVLEAMTNSGFPGLTRPSVDSGEVVRIDPSGKKTVIATGLTFPTAIALGPDGALYVANHGFGGQDPGVGQILRIKIRR